MKHQNQFDMGFAQNPAGSAYKAALDLLARLKVPSSKGRGGDWRGKVIGSKVRGNRGRRVMN